MRRGELLFRGCLLILLAGILIVQCLILNETHNARPPTLGELREAKGDARLEVVLRKPLVHVSGSVDVE